MEMIRISIAGASGYSPVDEACNDKITVTDSSIGYEYKHYPMAQSETNVYRKWSYKTTSLVFKQVFSKIAAKTPHYLYYDEILFATDIGSTEIIVTF